MSTEPTARRILIVDDQPEVCSLVSKVLKRLSYEVLTAFTGEDALEVMKKEQVDLLIVDKNLPRMHGGEVIVHARKLQPNVAVILITAFPEPFSLPPERLDGYLAKPFKSLKTIEEAVVAALESSEAARRRFELRDKLTQVVADLKPGAKKRI
ncbi:MAG: response regulator [Myxococcaceae bacterium]|nr:response regulator [Myxococcaceae bacterium]